MRSYNQFTALKALTKGSLLAMLKSPSALFFSIAFPLIFIVAFGLMNGGGMSVDIAFDKQSDTTNAIYQSLVHMDIVNVNEYADSNELLTDFKKGKLAAVLDIQRTHDSMSPYYTIQFKTCNAAGNDPNIAKQILTAVIDTLDRKEFPDRKTIARIAEPPAIEGRPFKYLDFLLPGMLGFSLLSAGIFGTAFVFFTLRQTLVLKRFFATPVKRLNIIISEGVARLFLQILSAAIIILVGYVFFDYTLVHGLSTFIQMLLLSMYGLIIFLGMGFVVSSLAKNDASIPPLANSITMPQLLLSGVFMSPSNFPSWLQPICKALPLTQFNNAMRVIAFEGKSLLDCGTQLGILTIWLVIIYAIAVKVFRWE
ncbi:MAG: ABC transporter permease [Chitinophagaceae bacterium]|nr:ABC transporter permease [Chitinophagaceae bacterium]